MGPAIRQAAVGAAVADVAMKFSERTTFEMKRIAVLLFSLLFFVPSVLLAMQEGTRHITGKKIDLYFMNDKVFGSVENHPLWAIYNCGSDINGEIDVEGTYHKFNFQYQRGGQYKVTGSFGSLKMALGNIEQKDNKVIYHVFVDDKECTFSIKYEKIQDKHMVNSVIEGKVPTGKKISLTVDGHLCPFATTGIVMIAAGSIALPYYRLPRE
ncbi:MAG: hypothetical protein JRD47_11365, partial [Deltaproteobacteria bacterium]|nr:hypothetical protein [Deltaproteobacteria bacterium]